MSKQNQLYSNVYKILCKACECGGTTKIKRADRRMKEIREHQHVVVCVSSKIKLGQLFFQLLE